MMIFRQAPEGSVAHALEPRTVGLGIQDGSRSPAGSCPRLTFMKENPISEDSPGQRVSGFGEIDDIDLPPDRRTQICCEGQQVDTLAKDGDVDIGAGAILAACKRTKEQG
jgi:hypothetical protein